jgi:hypothetical protein
MMMNILMKMCQRKNFKPLSHQVCPQSKPSSINLTTVFVLIEFTQKFYLRYPCFISAAFRKPPPIKKPKPKPKTVVLYEVEDPSVQEAYEKYADGDPEMMMTEMATLHLTQTSAGERPLTTTMGGQRVEQLVDEFATRTKVIKTPMPKELMPGSTVVGAGNHSHDDLWRHLLR